MASRVPRLLRRFPGDKTAPRLLFLLFTSGRRRLPASLPRQAGNAAVSPISFSSRPKLRRCRISALFSAVPTAVSCSHLALGQRRSTCSRRPAGTIGMWRCLRKQHQLPVSLSPRRLTTDPSRFLLLPFGFFATCRSRLRYHQPSRFICVFVAATATTSRRL